MIMKISIIFNSWWFWHLTTMIMLITIISYWYMHISYTALYTWFLLHVFEEQKHINHRSFLLEELHSSWSYQPVTLCSKPLTIVFGEKYIYIYLKQKQLPSLKRIAKASENEKGWKYDRVPFGGTAYFQGRTAVRFREDNIKGVS